MDHEIVRYLLDFLFFLSQNQNITIVTSAAARDFERQKLILVRGVEVRGWLSHRYDTQELQTEQSRQTTYKNVYPQKNNVVKRQSKSHYCKVKVNATHHSFQLIDRLQSIDTMASVEDSSKLYWKHVVEKKFACGDKKMSSSEIDRFEFEYQNQKW